MAVDSRERWLREQVEPGKRAVAANYDELLGVFSGDDEEAKAARRREKVLEELEGMQLQYRRRARSLRRRHTSE